MPLDPAVAAVRLAVRRGLSDVSDRPVLVACSGGADSLALLAGTVFEARAGGWHVVGVTVDHALQDGSAGRAEQVVAQMAGLGVAETVGVRVSVTASGQGPEAAAREARYAVLGEVAERLGSEVVLLGHTLDDQAETVLLGLARGSGGRALSGMRRAFAPYRRPLLELTREQTEAACRALGLEFWTDPHNADPRFTRSRVRERVLPVLEAELGPGVAAALARSADLLRADADLLDALAASAADGVERDGGLDCVALAGLPDALRTRVLRRWLLARGAHDVGADHVAAVDALVTGWRGQGPAHLPGLRVARTDGLLHPLLGDPPAGP